MSGQDRVSSLRLKVAESWNVYRRNTLGIVGLGILGFFTLVAVFGGYIAPYSYHALTTTSYLSTPFSLPSWSTSFTHGNPSGTFGLLGSDEKGRDIFSELVYGTRVTLLVGLATMALLVTIGLLIGLVSGYFGGKKDRVLMTIADIAVILSALTLPLLIILDTALGPSTSNLIVLLGVIFWAFTARYIRAQVITIRESTYIESAKSIGARDRRIMFSHILPNVLPMVFANAALAMAFAIIVQAGVSFIGLGDPSALSWGSMLFAAVQYQAILAGAWLYLLVPGICIALVVLAALFISQALDDIVNPHRRAAGWLG
jgi:peptide/nickel transport system permease protein